MLKKIGIGLVVVVALVVIISFMLPAKVTVERSITVDAPIEIVYNQVNDFHNWPAWSPWAEKDPDMKIEYSGSEKGKGAKYCWNGDPETVGIGCLSILDNEENASIKTLLEFEGMTPGNGSWNFEKVNDGVKITWAMESDMTEPLVVGRYFGLMMDGLIGPDFEKGLSNIKNVVESMPQYTIDITEDKVPAIDYICIRRSATGAEIPGVMDEIVTKMMSFIEKNELQLGDNVFAIWHINDMEKDYYEFSFAYEVIDAKEIDDDEVKFGSIEGFDCARGVHMGDYEDMMGSYGEMIKYIQDKGYTEDNEWMEFYITDTEQEPDTAKWETHIVYPIG